jgi:hypothetical protein
MHAKKRYLVAMLALWSFVAQAHEYVTFDGGTRIEFSKPLLARERSLFGPGLKKATFVRSDGSRFDLFAMERLNRNGGILFSGVQDVLVSPSGRFAVLITLRVGVLREFKKPNRIVDRQYCPAIDTHSGCILSNQTGGICGGRWDGAVDTWHVGGESGDFDATAAMTEMQGLDVDLIWEDYQSGKMEGGHSSLSGLIESKLGVQNILACANSRDINIALYERVAAQLEREGDRASARYIRSQFGARK